MGKWLTDKEKRILFSALTREKSVCIQVDKQCESREPYEQSLQSVCESLEHKFYYDRLFKQMEKQIRAEAIDDFAEKAIKIAYEANNRDRNLQPSDMVADIHYKLLDLAKQLKAGGENE